MWTTLFLIAALIVFGAAALGAEARINLTAFGLMLCVAAALVAG